MDFVSFLSMIIYEVLDTLLCCSKHNICGAWFLGMVITAQMQLHTLEC